ncbi:n/a [Ectocarpus siliculosus]|uniref:N/a n=1 Tax=Ectocarpus siliculosus TaxID=2880 RepID=D7G1S1_ECTSI|nr:n/a [Ectocarpus siliculosus]|eukprot:CBJ33316.1 n/a [Ectocarpus siliculosus]
MEGGSCAAAWEASPEIEPFNSKIPVFLERTFRLIDNTSDDIVSWSAGGDSFIIKQKGMPNVPTRCPQCLYE